MVSRLCSVDQEIEKIVMDILLEKLFQKQLHLMDRS